MKESTTMTDEEIDTEYKALLRDELDKAGIDQAPEASIHQWMEGDTKCFSNTDPES